VKVYSSAVPRNTEVVIGLITSVLRVVAGQPGAKKFTVRDSPLVEIGVVCVTVPVKLNVSVVPTRAVSLDWIPIEVLSYESHAVATAVGAKTHVTGWPQAGT